MPRGFGIDWAGISADEVARGNEAIFIFLICLAFVYLILAAQYESFILPLAVILSLPAGVFGSFLLLKLMGLENNIYAQVALVMLIGLLGKNAVLIVEFAVQKHRSGETVLRAAIQGSVTRFRPILMTSFRLYCRLDSACICKRPRCNRQPYHRCCSGWRNAVRNYLRCYTRPGLVLHFWQNCQRRTCIC